LISLLEGWLDPPPVAKGMDNVEKQRRRREEGGSKIPQRPTSLAVAAVILVIVSLSGLLFIPVALYATTHKLRAQIRSEIEPARAQVTNLQVALGENTASIHGYVLTRGAIFAERYRSAAALERASLDEIRKATDHLDGEEKALIEEIERASEQWHLLPSQVVSGEISPRQYVEQIADQQLLYETMSRIAAELDRTIAGTGLERRQRITRIEWLAGVAIMILAALAMASALLVAHLARGYRRLASQLQKRADEERLLAHIGTVLSSSLDYEVTLETLTTLAAESLADYCMVEIVEHGRLRRVAAAHREPEKKIVLDQGQPYAFDERRTPLMQPLISGGTVFLPSISDEEMAQLTRDSYHGEMVARLAPVSIIATPLISRGQRLGILILLRMHAPAFRDEDVPLAEEVARRAALAVDNARLYQKSQQAVAAREDVLTVVSHDLRSPLTTVSMAASLLLEDDLTPEQTQELESVRAATHAMRRLIEDLLDAARIEGGRLHLQIEEVTFEEIVDDVVAVLRPQAEEKQQRLVTKVSQNLPTLNADPKKLHQVLSNLIGNAVKFTPRDGLISLKAKQVDSRIAVTITDSGPGIEADDLEAIFTPYWQGGGAERIGTGLGLAIVKGIVEAHGGVITAESEPGAGTTFRFEIPLGSPEDESVESDPA
jgi:signal transduction histidine kinase/CHASE3 domain sensor protein